MCKGNVTPSILIASIVLRPSSIQIYIITSFKAIRTLHSLRKHIHGSFTIIFYNMHFENKRNYSNWVHFHFMPMLVYFICLEISLLIYIFCCKSQYQDMVVFIQGSVVWIFSFIFFFSWVTDTSGVK